MRWMLATVTQPRNRRYRCAFRRTSGPSGCGLAFDAGLAFPLYRYEMLSPSSIAFLKRLLDAPAPSGFETVAARVWRTEANTFSDKVSADVGGNSKVDVNCWV